MISFSVLLLALVMQFKHFTCDFVWQTGWMVRGKGQISGWVKPLAVHAAIHSLGCFVALALYNLWLWPGSGLPWTMALKVAAADGAIHFVIDRLKAHPSLGGRFKPTQDAFWVALGLDQMAHHVAGLLICLWAYTHTVVLVP